MKRDFIHCLPFLPSQTYAVTFCVFFHKAESLLRKQNSTMFKDKWKGHNFIQEHIFARTLQWNSSVDIKTDKKNTQHLLLQILLVFINRQETQNVSPATAFEAAVWCTAFVLKCTFGVWLDAKKHGNPAFTFTKQRLCVSGMTSPFV